MTATVHAVVGGAIASRVPDPLFAVLLAIASHVVLDLIPHWDFGVDWRQKSRVRFFIEALGDLLLGGVLISAFFLNRVQPTYLYGMMVMAQLPDWIEMPYLFLRWNVPPFSTMYKVGAAIQTRAPLIPGLATQISTIALAVWWGRSSP